MLKKGRNIIIVNVFTVLVAKLLAILGSSDSVEWRLRERERDKRLTPYIALYIMYMQHMLK